jgi:hypothetical protein
MVCAKKGRIVIGAFVTENTLTKSGKIVNNNYFIFKSLRKPWCRSSNGGGYKGFLLCPPLEGVARSDGGG